MGKNKYKEEELIRQIQILAEELGKTPTIREFNKDTKTASSMIPINRFGSWNKFLEAAGLKVNKAELGDEELIQQVLILAKKLGRTPTEREFNRDSETVSATATIDRFGSWNAFLEAAGLKVNKKTRG